MKAYMLINLPKARKPMQCFWVVVFMFIFAVSSCTSRAPTSISTPTITKTLSPTQTSKPISTSTSIATKTKTKAATATATTSATHTELPEESIIFPSRPVFQVFIINPLRTCLAGNDFASGNVCFGKKCGDCDCKWEDFDPPAPMVGIAPDRIDAPEYDGYDYKACVEITLLPEEIDAIKNDMALVKAQVYEWSGGALDLQLRITEIPHEYTGFVAPDFVIGPFEIDDELLNPYVGVDTDFIYVVSGVYDRAQGKQLQIACGGSYGEMSIHGAGFANIQYNDVCNSIMIDQQMVYEPLMHEWIHNLDWALYNINLVPDHYQFDSPDWAKWQHASWPACGKGADDPLSWFPSIDFCEWDPDWIDCNNVASAGRCIHAGELNGQISWYEHVISAHYPRDLQFVGNSCRDGRQNFSETDVDQGWPCP